MSLPLALILPLIFVFAAGTAAFVLVPVRKLRRREEAVRRELRGSLKLLEAGAALTNSAAFDFDPETRKITGTSLLSELWPIHNGMAVPLEEWVCVDDQPEMSWLWEELSSGRRKIATFDYRAGKAGRTRYYRLVSQTTARPDGSTHLVGVVQDVTELRAMTENQRTINYCLEVLLRGGDMRNSVVVVLKAVCAVCQASCCHIDELESGSGHGRWFAGYDSVADRPLDAVEPGFCFEITEPWFMAVRDGREIDIADLGRENDAALLGSRIAFFRDRGCRTVRMVGIRPGGELWGNLVLEYDFVSRRQLSRAELAFLQAAVRVVELVVERFRNRTQLVAALEKTQLFERNHNNFIALFRYEIKTSLNSLIGCVDLLRNGNPGAIDREKYLNAIFLSADALVNLIDFVSEIISPELINSGSVTREPVDFGELCRNVIKDFSRCSTDSGIHFENAVPALPVLYLDGGGIRKILFSLIGWETDRNSGGVLQMWANFTPSTGGIGCFRFGVTDRGPLLTEYQRTRLLAPFAFECGGNDNESGGAGNGMKISIAHRAAERLGGKFRITGDGDRGNTFDVTIEGVHSGGNPVSGASSAGEISPPPKTTFATKVHSILIVDDVDNNLVVMEAMCKRFGDIEVTTVMSGVDALAALESKKFDVVLTDLWMPGMNGAELARSIHADRRFASIPIVAVTADAAAQENFEMSCFAGLLLKPLTIDKIRRMLALVSPS